MRKKRKRPILTHKPPYKYSVLIIATLALLTGVAVYILNQAITFSIFKPLVWPTIHQEPEEPEILGALSGKACPGATQRPVAVMLAGDREARPLSGLQAADMVIEMPVIVNSITRYMALYQCGEPAEIGSVRSARAPFIGLAKGYDAVFAHWGGEHDALTNLRGGIINNVDALVNPYTAFWRKPAIPRPHNGFTSYERLTQAAQKMGYDLSFEPRAFFTFSHALCNDCSQQTITVGYPGAFRVSYSYDPQSNIYLRNKGGTPELDALTGQQVAADNVVILWANIYHTYSQYDTIDLEGKTGRLQAFISGNIIDGTWKKEGFASPLLFYDEQGKPLALTPGSTWVQVLGLDQYVIIDPPVTTLSDSVNS